MKEQIRQRALDLGFDDCRFTTAAPPAHTAAFENWIQAGHHGAMGYLERNALKRIDPEKVLESARSIVVLAASYHTGAQNGGIARYARFADYHDVLAERLKPLTDFVNQIGGGDIFDGSP